MKIKLIADTTCDLTKQEILDMNIEVIPMNVISKQTNEEFLDGVDITAEKIYEEMKKGKTFSTSQVNFQSFIQSFEKYYKNDEIAVYISLSSGISSTYETSLMAINELNEVYGRQNVYSIDSKSASAGIGSIIKSIYNNLDNFESVDELKLFAYRKIDKVEHIFAVENLEYLVNGGRLSRTSGLIGGMLNIKPIFKLDTNGKIEVVEKVRGINRVISYIIYELKNEIDSGEEIEYLNILYTEKDDKTEKLKDEIIKKLNFDEERIGYCMIGSLIGPHVGPGAMGLVYLKK